MNLVMIFFPVQISAITWTNRYQMAQVNLYGWGFQCLSDEIKNIIVNQLNNYNCIIEWSRNIMLVNLIVIEWNNNIILVNLSVDNDEM